MAYAGIGHPQKFYDTLTAAGINVRQTRDFPDHHFITVAEADEILNTAGQQQLYLMHRTEKNMARIQGNPALADLA